jgi:butyrate kinase
MTPEEIDRILRVDCGLYGHLGTSSGIEIEKRIAQGDRKAEIVYQAMAYQISKDIGALGTVAFGKVDAIILTGGLAHSDLLTGWITERVGFLAPVVRVPGGMEMEALAGGVARVMSGEEAINDYDAVRTKRPFEELEQA